jgi:hypothetical protein
MKILVCGGRDYSDQKTVFTVLNVLSSVHGSLTIIEGGQSGADRLARRWAHEHKAGLITIEADWEGLGRKAGPIRNAEMLKLKPDAVLAFPGGCGTADMVRRARAAGFSVTEVKA